MDFFTNTALVAATSAIAVFTWKLWRVSDSQASILNEQRKLMDAMLKNAQAAERAWITLQDIHFAPPQQGRDISVALELKNDGQTPGFISELRVTAWIRKEHEPWPDWATDVDYGGKRDRNAPVVLVAGEMTRTTGLALSPLNTLFFDDETSVLCIRGFFRYRLLKDETRNKEYRFAREYDRTRSLKEKASKFQYPDAPDYNYAE